MAKRPYRKPALSYTEQIEKLRSRGMAIANDEVARFYLQHINYYRLSAYWRLFEADHDEHRFLQGTTFEDVLKLYSFDRQLRLLLLDAIERLEVSIRTQWAFYIGKLRGPHGYLDQGMARNSVHLSNDIADLKKEVARSHEVFIDHFSDSYQEELPPIWVVSEVISMGLLARFYANLDHQRMRRLIAGAYGLSDSMLESWLHHLSALRNLCAHHARLWKRQFHSVPIAPRTKPIELQGAFVSRNSIYNSLVLLLYLVKQVSRNRRWHSRLKALLISNQRWLADTGFPDRWSQRSIWKNIE